ncbi:MAG: hypothetical protein JWP37_432, partial [Mucilaginibacter sp.]|nr:hypothetical protein [Mucilaginibacter sp.]
MAGFRHSVKFYLQKSEPQNKVTQIRAYVRYNNKLVIIGTGKMIEPRYWNNDKNEPKQTAKLANADKLKSDIENIGKWLSSTFEYLTSKENVYPEPEKLKELCLQVLKTDGTLPDQYKKPDKLSVAGYIKRLISDTKSGRRSNSKGETLAPGTIRHYNSAAGVINRYLKHCYKSDIGFAEIDLQFYYDFRDYAYQVEKLSDNYFGTAIKFLKTVMTEAADEGLHNNNIHNHKRFVKVRADVENIYLNQDQLQKLFDKDLSEKPKLDRVRDLFLVGCWTGLRFSDFTNIKASNIDGNFIEIKTQKTGETVAIPIHSTVKAIMHKYEDKTENSLPPAISNVKLNLYLKELGKEVKFNEIITLEKAKA